MILRLVLFTLTFSLGESNLADNAYAFLAKLDGDGAGSITDTGIAQAYVELYDEIQQKLQGISIDINTTDEQCIIDAGGCKSISNIDDFFEENKQSMDLCVNPDGIHGTIWGTLVRNVTVLEALITDTYTDEISKGHHSMFTHTFGSTDPNGHGKFLAWFHGDSISSEEDKVISTKDGNVMYYIYPHDAFSSVLLNFTTIDGTEIFQYNIDILSPHSREPAFALFPLGTCNKPVEYVVFTPSEICISDFNWRQDFANRDDRDRKIWKMVEKIMKKNYIERQCESRPASTVLPKETLIQTYQEHYCD